MKAKLLRLKPEEKQTLGVMLFFDDDVNLLLTVKTLELPDRDNQLKISRICSGRYNCKLRYSATYGWHFILEDVPGRTYILIHFGNYYRDTEGCILVGNNFTDIDGDGHRDVTSSKKTMQRILAIAPKEFELLIVDE